MRSAIVAIAAVAAIGALAGQAEAHAHLVKADPAKDAAVAAPKALRLEFCEKLEPKFSGVDLIGTAGAAPSAVTLSGNSMLVTPKATLAPGAYTVKWTAVADDGHKMTGVYGFTVR
jgi:methionine-rich copper-binding protein CopC